MSCQLDATERRCGADDSRLQRFGLAHCSPATVPCAQWSWIATVRAWLRACEWCPLAARASAVVIVALPSIAPLRVVSAAVHVGCVGHPAAPHDSVRPHKSTESTQQQQQQQVRTGVVEGSSGGREEGRWMVA
jgi:hypothetical protein